MLCLYYILTEHHNGLNLTDLECLTQISTDLELEIILSRSQISLIGSSYLGRTVMVLLIFLTLGSTTDSELFAPQEMVIQHDIQLAIIPSLVPSASQTSWMFILMLIVCEYMLTPCWGGVLLGGTGWVNCCLNSYGKEGNVIAHKCTDKRIANKGTWVILHRYRTGILSVIMIAWFCSAGPMTAKCSTGKDDEY